MCSFIYKLAQDANFLTCNETFAIVKSKIILGLHEFVDMHSIFYIVIWILGLKENQWQL
jgi:hypothetical protein